MNANTAIEFVVFGGAIPAALAFVLLIAFGWLWPKEIAGRYGAGLAFGASVLIGFVVWHDVKAIALMQFWDWLPYLGLLAAFVTGLTRAGGVGSGERWFAIYLFAMSAAWLTVPHWPEFEPAWPRRVWSMSPVPRLVA